MNRSTIIKIGYDTRTRQRCNQIPTVLDFELEIILMIRTQPQRCMIQRNSNLSYEFRR